MPMNDHIVWSLHMSTVMFTGLASASFARSLNFKSETAVGMCFSVRVDLAGILKHASRMLQKCLKCGLSTIAKGNPQSSTRALQRVAY